VGPQGTDSQFADVIETLASASVHFPNKEAWRLLLDGLKARFDPVTATHLRPRVWARRKELVKRLKAVRRETAKAG
jgi:predicted HAD superfamily Cof-like phosphohydrolase